VLTRNILLKKLS